MSHSPRPDMRPIADRLIALHNQMDPENASYVSSICSDMLTADVTSLDLMAWRLDVSLLAHRRAGGDGAVVVLDAVYDELGVLLAAAERDLAVAS